MMELSLLYHVELLVSIYSYVALCHYVLSLLTRFCLSRPDQDQYNVNIVMIVITTTLYFQDPDRPALTVSSIVALTLVASTIYCLIHWSLQYLVCGRWHLQQSSTTKESARSQQQKPQFFAPSFLSTSRRLFLLLVTSISTAALIGFVVSTVVSNRMEDGSSGRNPLSIAVAIKAWMQLTCLVFMCLSIVSLVSALPSWSSSMTTGVLDATTEKKEGDDVARWASWSWRDRQIRMVTWLIPAIPFLVMGECYYVAIVVLGQISPTWTSTASHTLMTWVSLLLLYFISAHYYADIRSGGESRDAALCNEQTSPSLRNNHFYSRNQRKRHRAAIVAIFAASLCLILLLYFSVGVGPSLDLLNRGTHDVIHPAAGLVLACITIETCLGAASHFA